MEKPRWGFVDIIVVYLGITAISTAAAVVALFTGIGLERDPIRLFIFLFGVQFAATVLFVRDAIGFEHCARAIEE